MGSNMISDHIIGWQKVDNNVDLKMVDGSLLHSLKTAKRIARRTRALNSALKKFSQLKSYSQYVKAKTKILRNVTDNESTDEDTDTYYAGLEFRREDSFSLSPSPSPPPVENLPTGNLNYTRNTDSVKSSGKEKGARRKTSGIELCSLKSSRKEQEAISNTDEIKSDSVKSSGKRKRRTQTAVQIESDSVKSSGKRKRATETTDEIESESVKSTEKRKRKTKKTDEVEPDSIISPKNEERAARKTDVIESDSPKSPKQEKEATEKTDEVELGSPQSPKQKKGAATTTDEIESDRVKSSGKKKRMTKQTDEIESDSPKSSKKEREATRKTDEIETDSVKSSGKTKRSPRKMDNTENDFSEPTETKDMEHTEQASIKEKNMGSKQKKILSSVKRNLTSALDNFDNDISVPSPLTISPIARNSEIHGEQNDHDVSNSIESSRAVNHESDCDSVYDKPAFVTNEISVDVHAENDDEEITKEDEKQVEQETDDNGNQEKDEDEDKDEDKDENEDENEDEDDKKKLQLQEDPESMDESPSKKSQPVITCTEILTSKYKIVRDENEADVVESPDVDKSEFPLETTLSMSGEISEVNEPSPETKRVGQMKRINLTTNSSDSEESELSEQEDEKIVAPVLTNRIDASEESQKEKSFLQKVSPPLPSSSQGISHPSDSDESADEADDEKRKGKVSLSTIFDSKTSTSTRTENEHRTPDKNTAKDQNQADLVESLDYEKSEFSPETRLVIDEEATEDNELSPESKRVGQLKRMNLITNSSESEESEQEDEKIVAPAGTNRVDASEKSQNEKSLLQKVPPPLPSSSQAISDPSDSDESDSEPDTKTNNREALIVEQKNHSSFSLSTISNGKISPSTRTKIEHRTPDKRAVKNTVEDENAEDLVERLDFEKSELSPETTLVMDEEVIEENEPSPESKRVGQLKRLNLITNSSESEESEQEDEEIPAGTNRIDDPEVSQKEKSSQVIEDPSDSDESADEADNEINNREVSTVQSNNHNSLSSPTISDSKNSALATRENKPRSPEKRPLENTVKKSTKSIRSQILEQENVDSSAVSERIEEAVGEEKSPKKRRNSESIVKESSTSSDKVDDVESEDGGNVRTINKDVNRFTNHVPYKSDALRYVLKNLARNEDESEREIENFAASCSLAAERRKKEEQETEDFPRPRSRPVELCDFIDREELVANEELSTITAKDLKESAREDGDEEIWLMEIPAFIFPNGVEFRGKDMTIESGRMTINGTTYKTTCRDEKSVSCILRAGKKKARFKTVHLETAGCIVVRQESSKKAASPSKKILSPAQTQTPVQRSIVPFPKNLKLRNPLLGLDALDTSQDPSTTKHAHESSSSNKSRKRKQNTDDSNKKRKKCKKSEKTRWHVDTFAIKSSAKKKRLDKTVET